VDFLTDSPPTTTLIETVKYENIPIIIESVMIEQTKQCSKCKLVKSVNNFSMSNPTKKDGYNSWCKQCCRETNKRISKTPSGIFQSVKSRSKYYGKHEVEITQEEFVEWYENEPKKCAYCDIPEDKLWIMKELFSCRWMRLTVDCRDATMPYAVGNLMLACDKCNIVKNNVLSYDEMRYVGQTFVKSKWQALDN